MKITETALKRALTAMQVSAHAALTLGPLLAPLAHATLYLLHGYPAVTSDRRIARRWARRTQRRFSVRTVGGKRRYVMPSGYSGSVRQPVGILAYYRNNPPSGDTP
jgi:hypothetical protein